jgi:multidrug resistance efflux pump
MPLLWWGFLPAGSKTDDDKDHLAHTVTRGAFVHEITERGEVESSSNDELRCQVKATNGTGTAIVRIVAEGTSVNPGDELVAFDSAALEAERQKQQIACNASAAKVAKAQNAYKTAVITKREYEEGTFKQEEVTAQAEIDLKEGNLRQAEQRVQYSTRLAAKGFIAKGELESDELALKKAVGELEVARTKLQVLREFTREKKLLEFEGNIDTAKNELEAEKNSHALDLEKLKLLDSQMEKCVIRAPVAGQVVYPPPFWSGDSEVRVGVGIVIREGQRVLRLPDLTKMQVNAKIHESKIHHVKVDMAATVKLEAMPDAAELKGKVIQVKEYPEESNFWNSTKQYSTVIQLDHAPPGTRPGMTAEVKIHIESQTDVLTVPVQAVVERAGTFYCARRTGSGWDVREVRVGPNSDKFVVILDGLEDGDDVMLDLREHASELGIPESDLPTGKNVSPSSE